MNSLWKINNCMKKVESINKSTVEQLIARDLSPKK